MSLTVEISLSQEAQQFVHRMGMVPQLSVAMCGAMDKENQLSVDAIKQKISGSPQKGLRGSQVLHRRTGRLRDSIGRTDAVASSTGNGVEIRSSVGSGVGQGTASVRYAAIHEFGGTIDYPSRPTLSHNPRWAKKHPNTKAYSVTMPERSYIRSTLHERQQQYSNRLSQSIIGFWKGRN